MNTLRCLPAVAVARAPLRRSAAATSTPQQASPASKTRSEQPSPASTVMTPGPGLVPGLPATPGSGRSTAAIQPAYRAAAGRSRRAPAGTRGPPGPVGTRGAVRPAPDRGLGQKLGGRTCEPRVVAGRLITGGL